MNATKIRAGIVSNPAGSTCGSLGFSLHTAFARLLPRQIGRFRIEAILGQGGFGIVYLGHDEQLQRKVAIKVPKPQFVERAEDRELYLKEARTLRRSTCSISISRSEF